MSRRKVGALFALAVIGSAAAYSAHFVGEQIAYLHDKLSPPTEQLKLSSDWPGTAASLPALGELPKVQFQHDTAQPKY
ncbi:hypothetical protein [Pseudomonas fluorescens]|uniref:hypothetical protein n=1 Tax=Pseudomonas fluorescens TaxID=294 RepID=UPI001240828C|nr:hypothetical protein [Pseudomonas fluorescens]